MKIPLKVKISVIGLLAAVLSALLVPVAQAEASPATVSLAGTWTLVAADVLRADGVRARDYGADPKGLLLIDSRGRYSLQIFKAERTRFASGNKQTGTPAEYQSAVLGSSTHFGTISVDPIAEVITFHIENASYPDWEGTQQARHFELHGDQLTYRVAPRPDGSTPISIWRRLQ
jgi:hypothetical protein